MREVKPAPEAVVTVVTYNSATDIERCLRSLNAHFSPLGEGRAEVHVVDNASSDGTPAILKRLAVEYDWLKLHFSCENIGFGPGNNLVLNSVPAKAYILINADAWLVADSLSPTFERLATSPKTGIIGLPLVYPDGSPQSYSFMPSAWHRWLILLIGLRGMAKALIGFAPTRALMKLAPFSRNFVNNHGKALLNLNDQVAIMLTATGEVRPASWVAGAAMVLSPEFVEASGGFDPEIFLYGEDEDLCIRSHRLGFDVETLQTAPIVHNLGWGGSGGFRPRVSRMKYDSLKYFIIKNVRGTFNRAMMRLLLPAYVYGRNIGHFFREDV